MNRLPRDTYDWIGLTVWIGTEVLGPRQRITIHDIRYGESDPLALEDTDGRLWLWHAIATIEAQDPGAPLDPPPTVFDVDAAIASMPLLRESSRQRRRREKHA